MEHFSLMVAGQHIPSGTLEVLAPWDLSPIAMIETCDARGVERALQTAYDLFSDRDAWLLPSSERTATLMSENARTLAVEIARE